MGERKRVALVCEECGARNYKTTRSSNAEQGERLSLKKFCPHCKKRTVHRDSK